MIELRFLNGRDAGAVVAVKRFPFSVGRKDTDLVLAEPGVWDRHVVVEATTEHRFFLVPQPSATVHVDGRPVEERQPLRNGDILDLGSVRLQFRLAATRQRSLVVWETSVWLALVLLAAIQLGLALVW